MTARPERLALLQESGALKHLTRTVLMGVEQPAAAALSSSCESLDDSARWRLEPLIELVDEAKARFTDKRTSADAWLAPRIHASLRLTRREAADPRLWNFLSMLAAPDYVIWRHLPKATAKKPNPIVNQRRFCGPFHVQAFARLWWAAELFRDGPDYRPARLACSNQDVLNTILRLEIIHHRPTAQAIVGMLREGALSSGREVNALGQAVNTAGSTLSYEVLALDHAQDHESYRAWVDDVENALVTYEQLPEGPDDGRVPAVAMDTLTSLFETLFSHAPVRGRNPFDDLEARDAQ